MIRLTAASLMTVSLIALSACTGGDGNVKSSMASAKPNTSILYGERHDNLATIRKSYEQSPKDSVLAARYGKALRESGDLKTAKTTLLPFADDKTAGTLVNTELSAIYLSQGEFAKAENAARKAIKQDNNNYRAWRNLGNALDAQEKYKEGEEAFRKSLALWTGDDKVGIINNLALNLAAQGYTDQSLNMLYEAQKLDPGRVEIERNIRIIRTLNEPAAYNGTKKPVPENKAN